MTHQPPVKVRFLAAYDYTPSRKRQVTYAFKAGWTGSVKAECAARAIELGKAVEIKDAPPQAPPEST